MITYFPLDKIYLRGKTTKDIFIGLLQFAMECKDVEEIKTLALSTLGNDKDHLLDYGKILKLLPKHIREQEYKMVALNNEKAAMEAVGDALYYIIKDSLKDAKEIADEHTKISWVDVKKMLITDDEFNPNKKIKTKKRQSKKVK